MILVVTAQTLVSGIGNEHINTIVIINIFNLTLYVYVQYVKPTVLVHY